MKSKMLKGPLLSAIVVVPFPSPMKTPEGPESSLAEKATIPLSFRAGGLLKKSLKSPAVLAIFVNV